MTPSAASASLSRSYRSVPPAGRARVALVAAVSVAAVVTGGCSSSHPSADTLTPAHSAPASADGVQRVTIAATDNFRFGPAEVVVHPGKVALTLIDAGSYPHNLSLPDLGKTSASVSGSPGATSTSLMLTLTTPGRYSFVCTYHSSAGMKGTLVVLKRS